MRLFFSITAAATGLLAFQPATSLLQAADDDPLRYNRDIQPILSENCFFCHGPDPEKRDSDLRLDIREDAIAGKAIVPGDADASTIIERIFHDDPDELMPPPKSHRKLTDKDREKIKRWINEGAEYQAHWAYVPLQKPVPPAVESNTPVRNPIDAFVARGLQSEKPALAPQPEAAPERLIRRVSFDLTGLPPTPDEVAHFLTEHQKDPDAAYQAFVDRLLASPAYGERMTVDWLDAARYADSYGLQVDRDRDVWPWRDWVIRAFNDNLRYDDFITWQVAGDLLPDASDDQILATAFSRLHQQKVEGGSVEEEFRVEYIADRVHTFGTAFLGLTFECSRCHDHKYDPITQKDYYSLFAFFDDIDEAGLYSFFTPSVPTPAMPLRDAASKQKAAELAAAVAAEEKKLAAIQPDAAAFEVWKKSINDQPLDIPGEIGRFTFDDTTANSFANSAPEAPRVKETKKEKDPETGKDKQVETGKEIIKPATSTNRNQMVDGRPDAGKAILLTGDDTVKTEIGNFTRHQPFTVSVWISTPDEKERAVVLHRSRAWTDAASRGYELLIEEGRIKWSLIHFWPGNAISIRSSDKIPLNTWTQITVSNDGSSRADGLRIFIDGQPVETEVIRDHLTKNITGGGGDYIDLGERMRDRGFKKGLIDDLRVFNRQLSEPEVAKLHDPNSKIGDLKSLFLATRSEPYATQLTALQSARAAHNADADAVNEIMVMRELAEPKQAYVLNRGAYDQRGDPVSARTPEWLSAFPEGAPNNRLGLARWLTDPNNPLTARVAVNRFWLMAFGRGLVGTPEDFGSQGDRPQYPELLDWLAADFIESGWDLKALMKTIVSSHTYRQNSFASDSSVMVEDPDNRLLARGPRHRLPAEMIRDNALAASGLLVDKIGGPPVKPYDIAESFKPSTPSTGDGLYRRSLYTYWKRTGPSPAMVAFNAVKRDVCSVGRETTSTPLQALVLLNGPQFVEAARELAANSLRANPGDTDATLSDIFVRLTSRRPDPTERGILRRLHDEQRAYFASDAKAVEQFLATGEHPVDAEFPPLDLAAATMVAKALLSYDETVTKR